MSKDVFHIMFTLIRNQSVLVGGGASGEIQSLCLSVSLSVNAWHYNTASAGLSRQVARRCS